MGRELLVFPAQPAQIDDALDPRGLRRLAEAPCRLPVHRFERAARAHRVDEVIGRLDPAQGGVETRPFQDVPGDDLGRRPHLPLKNFWTPGQAAHAVSLALERPQEMSADVPAGAGEEDGPGEEGGR